MIKKTCYCENEMCYRYSEKVHRWVPDQSVSAQSCSACGKPLNCNPQDDVSINTPNTPNTPNKEK